jgi:elongator complex protein 4
MLYIKQFPPTFGAFLPMKRAYPPSTRLSSYNGQLLISTGIASLDTLLGGGLPIGTVLLVHEDSMTEYGHLISKYFIAEGIANGSHSVLVASADRDPQSTLESLMSTSSRHRKQNEDNDDAASSSQPGAGAEGDKMKIAWRYQNLGKQGDGQDQQKRNASSISTFTRGASAASQKASAVPKVPKDDAVMGVYCHEYDLTKKIDPVVLKEAQTASRIHTIYAEPSMETPCRYQSLMRQIRELLSGSFR